MGPFATLESSIQTEALDFIYYLTEYEEDTPAATALSSARSHLHSAVKLAVQNMHTKGKEGSPPAELMDRLDRLQALWIETT